MMDLLYKQLKDDKKTIFPAIGYEISTPDVRVVDAALAAGYRHVICECSAQHAAIISRLLQRWSGRVSRQQLFITLKVNISSASRVGYYKQFQQVLAEMECGTADLILLHNNMGDRYTSVQLATGWQLIEKIYQDGHTRCIGVSNLSQQEVGSMLETCTQAPHVFLQEHLSQSSSSKDDHLSQLCRTSGFCTYNKMCLLVKLSHLSISELPKAKSTLESLSDKHQITSNQVLIRWMLQQELGVVWQGTDVNHIATNFKVLDFALPHSDCKALVDAEPRGAEPAQTPL